MVKEVSTLLRQLLRQIIVIGVIPATRAAMLSLAAAAALLPAACGLPTIPFLEPPVAVSDSDIEIVFEHDTTNAIEEFRGYELYYRFYPATTDGEDQWRNHNDAILDSPRSPNPNRLTARGYRRIRDARDRSAPLIQAAGIRDESFQVRLMFPFDPETDDPPNEIDELDAIASFKDNIVRLRRGPQVNEDDGQTPKQFFPVETDPANGVYAVDDNDIRTALGNIDTTELARVFEEDGGLFVAVYGLAFGRTTDFERFYSVPVLLGRDIALIRD